MTEGWTHSDLIETVRLGWEVAAGVSVVIVGLMNRSLRAALRVMVTKAELTVHMDKHTQEHEDLEKRLAEGDVRFTRIETTLDHLPTRKDIDDLTRHLSQISADIAAVSAKVQGLCIQVHQLVQNELEHGR